MRGKKSKRNCSKGGTHVCTVKLKIIYPLDVRIEPTEIALGMLVNEAKSWVEVRDSP